MKNNQNYTVKKIVLLLALFTSLGLGNMVLAANNYALNEVIDVLIIYDTQAEQFYGNKESTELAAQHFVTATNTYWRQSGGHFAFNLAGVVKKDMNEMGFSESVITLLEDAKNSRTYMSNLLRHVSGWFGGITQEIRDLRKIYEADLVILLSDGKSSSVCGRAFMPQQKYLWPSHDEFQETPTANSNFFWNTSIMNVGCGSLTFAHELGHNLGLGHSRKQGNKGSLLEAGVGYGVDDLFSTIMAYSDAFNLPRSGRISRFSNPNELWQGVPTGVDGGGIESSNAVFAASGFAVPYIADLAGPSCRYTDTEAGRVSADSSRFYPSSFVAAGTFHAACLVTALGESLPIMQLQQWKWQRWINIYSASPSGRGDEIKGYFRNTESGYFRWAVRTSQNSGSMYTMYLTKP